MVFYGVVMIGLYIMVNSYVKTTYKTILLNSDKKLRASSFLLALKCCFFINKQKVYKDNF